jgi:hypothetical protein
MLKARPNSHTNRIQRFEVSEVERAIKAKRNFETPRVQTKFLFIKFILLRRKGKIYSTSRIADEISSRKVMWTNEFRV